MKFEIKLLLFTSILFNFSLGLLGPIYAIFIEKIGGGILEASAASTTFSLVTGILILVFGRLEDQRLNKKLMIVVGYFIHAFGILGYLFVTEVMHIYFIQAFLGIGAAILTPAFDALYSTKADKGKESSEWSYWEGGVRIVVSVAALAGGIIATFYGFKTLFIFMSIFAFLSAFGSAFLLKKKDFRKK